MEGRDISDQELPSYHIETTARRQLIISHIRVNEKPLSGSLFWEGSQKQRAKETTTRRSHDVFTPLHREVSAGKVTTGKALSRVSVRGGHNSHSLIVLIDAMSASERLGITPAILEITAEHQMTPTTDRRTDQLRSS